MIFCLFFALPMFFFLGSDVVEMACHAPLFVNDDIEKKLVLMSLCFYCCFLLFLLIMYSVFLFGKIITRWNPDVIVFNTWQHYGTPSYWMQKLFRESSGAMVHPTTISSGSSANSLAASAITWKDSENRLFLRVKASSFSCFHPNLYLKDYVLVIISNALVQIVNFEYNAVGVTVSTTGLEATIDVLRSTATVLTSANVMDENSFSNPNKVIYNNFGLSIELPIRDLEFAVGFGLLALHI